MKHGLQLPTTSMTHCGTDVAASLAPAVTTVPTMTAKYNHYR